MRWRKRGIDMPVLLVQTLPSTTGSVITFRPLEIYKANFARSPAGRRPAPAGSAVFVMRRASSTWLLFASTCLRAHALWQSHDRSVTSLGSLQVEKSSDSGEPLVQPARVNSTAAQADGACVPPFMAGNSMYLTAMGSSIAGGQWGAWQLSDDPDSPSTTTWKLDFMAPDWQTLRFSTDSGHLSAVTKPMAKAELEKQYGWVPATSTGSDGFGEKGWEFMEDLRAPAIAFTYDSLNFSNNYSVAKDPDSYPPTFTASPSLREATMDPSKWRYWVATDCQDALAAVFRVEVTEGQRPGRIMIYNKDGEIVSVQRGQWTTFTLAFHTVAMATAARLRCLAFLCCHVFLSNGLKTRVSESCSPLINRQSYSALRVGVGTPKQEFDLVADTGSSAVIVTHCECMSNSCFGSSGNCFTGTNRSSTFDVPRDGSGAPRAVTMTFGSGMIYGVVGTDVVTVGQESATMNGSVIFMYDHELDTAISDFEGIFGLGLPYKEADIYASSQQSWLVTASIQRFSMCFSNMEENGMLRLNSPAQAETLGNLGKFHWGVDFQGLSVGDEKAEIILCGDDDKTSSRRYWSIESECSLTKFHLPAMSVCAVKDSGTTLILAPSRHLWTLYSKLCDMWPRCSKAFAEDKTSKPSEEQSEPSMGSRIGELWLCTKSQEPLRFPQLHDWIKSTLEKWGIPEIHITNPFDLDPATQLKLDKKERFESLLADCASWSKDAADLEREMPAIFWHVAGVEGKTQTFSLPPSTYVVATGFNDQIICMPFFGEYDYETVQNGPIWIMGTPLFYEYEVHYDLSTEPPSLSFSKTSCGSYGQDGKAIPAVDLLRRRSWDMLAQAFLSYRDLENQNMERPNNSLNQYLVSLKCSRNQQLRRHDTKVRMPQMNTSLPLGAHGSAMQAYLPMMHLAKSLVFKSNEARYEFLDINKRLLAVAESPALGAGIPMMSLPRRSNIGNILPYTLAEAGPPLDNWIGSSSACPARCTHRLCPALHQRQIPPARDCPGIDSDRGRPSNFSSYRLIEICIPGFLLQGQGQSRHLCPSCRIAIMSFTTLCCRVQG
eukprot:s8_g24.t1